VKLFMDPAANSGSFSSPLSFDIDDGEAVLTQGFGGWETVARPQRVAITRYTGNDPIGQSVPILLDAYARSGNVEPRLQGLLRQSQGQSGAAPTVWKLDGPIFYPEKRWIVSGIEFGETLRVPLPFQSAAGIAASALTRQRATISFLEYVRPDQIRVRRVKRTYKPKGKKKQVEAKGQSIKQLTAEYYGTSEIRVARALGKAQKPPIRDVKKKLGKKKKIRLPVLKV